MAYVPLYLRNNTKSDGTVDELHGTTSIGGDTVFPKRYTREVGANSTTHYPFAENYAKKKAMEQSAKGQGVLFGTVYSVKGMGKPLYKSWHHARWSGGLKVLDAISYPLNPKAVADQPAAPVWRRGGSGSR